ncbi:UvrB/UvrC motif-containing protein [Brevibacillus ruminantium]|uniref:UvrB/UvrC motif-containing protein n=1 Tax=Brevibacillus ruminantium TaxID=2950604 RepID=A0ABY4WFS9_9BACL|nr:UvrB/UvrC motif-containing protein [Brevibacillus ruminantium]USG66015.1 UvrB/UvrC motif-containing protein [Brevibacillus ruminantium]
MNCEECGKRQATLHLTKIVNGEKTEYHICEQCAQEKGDVFPGFHNFSIHNLLSGLLHFDPAQKKPQDSAANKALRCETCGLTYAQFSKSGRFGCSDCYTFLGDRLDPLFRRIHGNTQHSGKVPERTGGQLKLRKELEQLKQALQRHVASEEFEKAAEIRDRIKSLEQKIGQL